MKSSIFFVAIVAIGFAGIQSVGAQQTCSLQCTKTSGTGNFSTASVVEVHINANLTLVLDKNVNIFAIINAEYILARSLNTSMVLIGKVGVTSVLVIDLQKNVAVVVQSNIAAAFQYDLTVLVTVFAQASSQIQANSSSVLTISTSVVISASYSFSAFISGSNTAAIAVVQQHYSAFFLAASQTKVVSGAFVGALVSVFYSVTTDVDVHIQTSLSLTFTAVSITSSSVQIIVQKIVEVQSGVAVSAKQLYQINIAIATSIQTSVSTSINNALTQMSSNTVVVALFGVTYKFEYSLSLSSNAFFSFEISLSGSLSWTLSIYYDAQKEVLFMYNSATNLAFVISKKLSLIVIANVKTGGVLIISISSSKVAVVTLSAVAKLVGSGSIQTQLVLYITLYAQAEINANGKSFKEFVIAIQKSVTALITLYGSSATSACQSVYAGLYSQFFASFSFSSSLLGGTTYTVSQSYVQGFLVVFVTSGSGLSSSTSIVSQLSARIASLLFGIGGFSLLYTFCVSLTVAGSIGIGK